MSTTNTSDWKEKYLNALEEFETSQQQEQNRQDILRKGLVRVSLAADGLDDNLDTQLDELRAALRGDREIESLEPLIAKLERTVVTLDDRRKDEHSEIETLLDSQLEKYLQLDLPRKDKSQIKSLRKSLPELLQGNGLNPEVLKSLNFIHSRISQYYLDQLEQSGAEKAGFFSRLFSASSDDATADTEQSAKEEQEEEHEDELLERPLATAPEISAKAPISEPSAQSSSDPSSNSSSTNQELVERLGHTLRTLLSHLDVPINHSARKESLLNKIQSQFELDEVPEFLEETAQLVASTRMVAQKEFEGFLVALHQRLNDIQDFLVTAREGEENAHANQKKLDENVRQELDEMRTNLETKSDLNQIKTDIEGMVERIVATVDAFHGEERKRRDDVYKRIETLAQRMESMESEASELKSNLEAQRMEALRDALTELPNRAAYDDQIEAEYSRWRRHGRPLSIAIADVDHFKKVNDTLGHLRGDKVLKLVAREISRRVRNEDFVARYGGEEFIIIMPDTDKLSAHTAIEKVRLAIADCPFNFNQQRIPISASFGIASFNEGDSIEDCFERADRALYKAKENGRNRIEEG